MKKKDVDPFILTDQVRDKIHQAQWAERELKNGKTPQEIAGLSDEIMEKLYRSAYELLVCSRIEDAADAFLFLVSLNPHRLEYWLGLGMATHQMKDLEGAVDAYEAAALCQLDNPIPYLYLGKCLFALHDRLNALHAFDLCIEYSAENPIYAELKIQAQAAKKSLSRV